MERNKMRDIVLDERNRYKVRGKFPPKKLEDPYPIERKCTRGKR